MYPAVSLVGGGLYISYKRFIVYEASIGAAIHTTNIGHSLGMYPYKFRILKVPITLSPYLGFYKGKTDGYDYGGLIDSSPDSIDGGLVGLEFFPAAHRVSFFVGAQFLSDEDYKSAVPIFKFGMLFKTF